MKLYKIGAVLAVLVCVIALVFSYLTWQDKLENVLDKPEEARAQSADKAEEEPEIETNDDSVNVEGLIANMDPQVQAIFEARNSEGESVKLLIAGSAALASGEPGYAEQLEASLAEAYGNFIETDIVSIEGTSESLANVDLSAGYDVVLLEPMTLMNNDRIAIEQEREHIREFDAALTAEKEDALVVLHPPQPIYGAGYYLSQVTALNEFASTNGYAYIDHWSAWPDTDDELLKEYLAEDGLPNNKGAQVWAEELQAYFIAN
ncbi:SGNH/GDSL hydrolase family protein [Planococcus sp. SE5232]|uniref:SGNH/GDSL hydrolase family protein n=1 Tax=unclassified Planococcus (in: firmicutes) TaxID=2662419 RepID=UPI003D6A6AB5